VTVPYARWVMVDAYGQAAAATTGIVAVKAFASAGGGPAGDYRPTSLPGGRHHEIAAAPPPAGLGLPALAP